MHVPHSAWAVENARDKASGQGSSIERGAEPHCKMYSADVIAKENGADTHPC